MTLLEQLLRQQLPPRWGWDAGGAGIQGLTPHQGLTPLAIGLRPVGTEQHESRWDEGEKRTMSSVGTTETTFHCHQPQSGNSQ